MAKVRKTFLNKRKKGNPICGSIKYEKTFKKIGTLIPVQYQGEISHIPWLGHIRDDNPKVNDHLITKLSVSHYTEKGTEFVVPYEHKIEARIILSKNFPQGKGIFIVTRQATKEELLKNKHPRHPRFIK